VLALIPIANRTRNTVLRFFKNYSFKSISYINVRQRGAELFNLKNVSYIPVRFS
jgi:hypothetical protein